MKKRITAGILAALMVLLAACSGQSGKEQPAAAQKTDTENASSESLEETGASLQEDAGEVTEKEAEEVAPRLQPEWTKDAVIYEVNIRQYTEEGTFAAFAEHLQTLKDMGITTLWLMPIHPISETNRKGTLGSYYSISDYREVNPEFGTKEDFAALVEQAHALGMKVMLDWVANHTGWDCAWITEHPDWYTKDADGNIIWPQGTDWNDVADLNYENQEMRAEMIDCMKYWVESYDIDGFRCDYAGGVPTQFWEDARAALEEIKPMYMLAEDNTTRNLLNQAFDFNYNWNLYEILLSVATGKRKASGIAETIPDPLSQEVSARYPDGTYTLNFLDNHDKNSWDRTIREAFEPDILPVMFSLIYTIPGAPLLYTGDEIALDHALAFMEKDAVDWENSEYDYRPLLAELGAIRKNYPALYCGNYGGGINYCDVGNKSVLAFYREKDGSLVKCIFNLSPEEQAFDASTVVDGSETVLLHGYSATDLFFEDHAVSEENLSGEVTANPGEFWILSAN